MSGSFLDRPIPWGMSGEALIKRAGTKKRKEDRRALGPGRKTHEAERRMLLIIQEDK